LAELDDDQSGGIDFAEFLRLATAKLSDKDSRAEVDKVFTSFDINKAVFNHLFRVKFQLPSLKKLLKNWEKT
jgi:Ca2+-binding EF-hand superfamily protein